jgi:tetratricopeptide (TPR) repeat protein
MAEPIRIFVSATTRGLKSFRIATAKYLESRGFKPIVQEEFECDYREIRRMLGEQIAPCEAVVLLVGPAYGFEPINWPDGIPRRSYTQLEYDIAIEWKKPVYRFLAAPDCPLTSFDPELPEHKQRQRDYLALLKHSDFVWYEFGSQAKMLDLLRNTKFHRRVMHLPFASIGSWFKGRDLFISKLRETLRKLPAHVAAVTAKQAIHGLGGVGKTRLALEYAYRFASEYSAILYVTADSPTSFRINLAALCKESVLNLPEKDSEKFQEQLDAVLRWLRQHAGWLLILDNVDTHDAATTVNGTLKEFTNGHVLITSRLTDWSGGVSAIELDTLSKGAAVDFLLERTAGQPAAPTSPKRQFSDTDTADAALLANELGGLALALEQAGAYIAVNGITFSEYRAKLNDVERDVLKWFDEKVMQYPKSVAVTWQASVNELYDDGRTLLNMLSWLAADPIPVEMIRGVPPDDEPLIHPIKNRFRAITELTTYSLATKTINGSAISVHRLVQDVTRLNIAKRDRLEWIQPALRMMNRFLPYGAEDVQTWDKYETTHPHIVAATAHADEVGNPSPTGQLLNRLGLFLKEKAKYRESEPLLLRALAINENLYGSDHPEVAVALNNLAEFRQITAKPEAESLYRRALSILEKSPKKNHATLASCLNNLAVLLCAADRLGEAEHVLRRALAIKEKATGPDNPSLALILNNLAELLHRMNRLDEAEPLFQRTLRIFESLGKDHPKVALPLHNLAELFHSMNRLDKAEPLALRALAISEKSYGPDHPNLAWILNNLASLFYRTNRVDKAVGLYERALAINEASYGPDHPNVAMNLVNLATLFKRTKRLSQAEPLYERAIRIWRRFQRLTGHQHLNFQGGVNSFGDYLENFRGMTRQEAIARIERLIEEDDGGLSG